MNSSKFERFRKLREEFEQISVQTYEDWSKVESWFRKAEPTIQTEWSEHLSKFQNSISNSRFWTYKYNNCRAITMSQHRDKSLKLKQAPQRDAKEAKKAKQDVLDLFDGLLRIEQIESAKIVTSQNTISKQKSDLQDDSFENPTDLWKARKGLPRWLWITLLIILLGIIPLLVAIIQGSLSTLLQQNTNKTIESNGK